MGLEPRAVERTLAIEIADSTAVYDREEKLPRCATAGVPELWIVDLEHAAIERYSAPAGAKCAACSSFGRGDSIASLGLAEIQCSVDELFR